MLRRAVASVLLKSAHTFPARRGALVLAALARGLSDEAEVIRRARQDWDNITAYSEASYVASGLMAWEQSAYAAVAAGGVVGLIGCGAGRDLIGLAKLGLVVDGLDCSAQAVEQARAYAASENLTVSVACGDAAIWTFPRPRYDAFIFSWRTYGCIPGVIRRIKLLARLRRQLGETGMVILSVAPFAGEGRRFVQLARLAGRLTGNPDLPSIGDIFDEQTLRCERFFTREDLDAEAHAAGFAVASWSRATQADVAILKPHA